MQIKKNIYIYPNILANNNLAEANSGKKMHSSNDFPVLAKVIFDNFLVQSLAILLLRDASMSPN